MKNKEKGNYIFSKSGAEFMKSISQRTQYEASMMAMIFIMLGLVFMSIYLPFFTDMPLILKIGTIVNCIAGLVFIGSLLITSYQQYVSYLAVMEIIEDGA